MFLICIYLKLWNVQIAFFHGIAFLLHTSKMMVNVVMTSLPIAKCSTLQHSPLFSILHPLLFFSTLLLPPPIFIYAYFSLATLRNFSIALSTHMLLQTPKLWKNIWLPIANKNNLRQLLRLFSSFNFLPISFIFLVACCLIINASSFKLWKPITIFFWSLVYPRGSMSPHHYEWMPQISSFDFFVFVALLG